ncbi:MAG: hypothetical protein ACK5Z5_00190 [Neisseriaceae bacterium]|jgi:hypothetical protein
MSEVLEENHLRDIARVRLQNRRQLTQNKKLDYVHREMIFEEKVLYNSMYQSLLDDDLSDKQIQLFYSEYYYGSIRGFLIKVMPLALKCFENENWINYIKDIRIEESRPKSHIILFEKFLASINLTLLEQQSPSTNFINKSKAGYTKNLPYSCGYALAVEVEADYQIYIVSKLTKRVFGEKIVNGNIWFDVHLAETGEEEHANMTINLADSCIKSKNDFDQFVNGFRQSCKDTETYMVDLYKFLKNF